MIESMILIYAGLCWLVFMKFRLVRASTFSVLTAVLIGAGGIGWLLMMMNLHQPTARHARFYFYTTSLVAQVQGKIIEVPVKINQPVKKGDVLARIDPTPFKARFDEAEATKQAAHRRLEFTRTELERLRGLVRDRAVSQEQFDTAKDQFDESTDAAAKADAEVVHARYQLDCTTITAPTDGHVAQLFVHPGFVTAAFPFFPIMVFVHSEDQVFVASFPQNTIQGIDEGDEVEVAFRATPGYVVRGRVGMVGTAIAQGQLVAGGELKSFGELQLDGMLPVVVQFEPGTLDGIRLPGGSVGEATVYTGSFPFTGFLRRVLLRISAWENYLFLGQVTPETLQITSPRFCQITAHTSIG
jgi:multidrug resistance efflux pump